MPGDAHFATDQASIRTISGFFDGCNMSIAYVGHDAHSMYLTPYLESLFDDSTMTRQALPEADNGAAEARELRSRRADVIFLDTEFDGRDEASDDGSSFLMPFRVHFVSDIRGGLDSLTRDISRDKRKKHRQRVRKFGYSYAISTDEAEFLDFYDRMYAPTMERRHGDAARSVTRSEALRIFREGMLILVRAGGIVQSGIACQIVPDRGLVNARLLGVPGGDADYFSDGATSTAYHFLLEWAVGEKYSWVDFQGCEPFLRKGTFQAKIRLGAALSHASGDLASRRLRVTATRDSAAVRSFLSWNPVVLVDENDDLGVGYFWDNDRPPQRDVPAAKSGVHFVREIHLDDFLARGAAPGTTHGVE